MNKKYVIMTPVLALASMTTFALAGSEKDVALPPPPPPSCAWTLGVEALYLKADSDDYEGYENQDYEFAYRLSLAYQNGDSWGYRLRYFDFEGTRSNQLDRDGYYEHGPEVSAADLEAFKGFTLGSWQGEYSVGLRYFEIFEPYDSNSVDVDYSGWGPTVGVELVRPINDALSFYTNCRLAYVFGDDDDHDTSIDSLLVELGAGIQYNFPLGNCESHVRLGVEAHHWSDLAYNEQDASAAGAVLGFGFKF